MSTPVPIGPGASFPNVQPNVQTASFTIGTDGLATIVFQPVDVNNPGVATLYDSSGNTIATLSTEGYESVYVPLNGLTYYFKATLGANLLAMIQPTIGNR